jgi:hypothetical protein
VKRFTLADLSRRVFLFCWLHTHEMLLCTVFVLFDWYNKLPKFFSGAHVRVVELRCNKFRLTQENISRFSIQ